MSMAKQASYFRIEYFCDVAAMTFIFCTSAFGAQDAVNRLKASPEIVPEKIRVLKVVEIVETLRRDYVCT